MKKFLLTTTVIVLGLYLGLQLVLGSSPVQRRVVDELKKALAEFGLNLQIESVEFSALSPKIYLNRVVIASRPDGKIQLPTPLSIDKIKIEFQPLALLSRRIVIEEAMLFHPRLVIPDVDELYRRVDRVIKQQKSGPPSKAAFALVLKKVGVVDALLNVTSKDPDVSMRSRSFTAYVQNLMSKQQTIVVQSRNLEFERNKSAISLDHVDIDVDLSSQGVRLNRAIIEGERLAINVKGASSLPKKGETLPSTLNLSYEVRVPLALLERISDLKFPASSGLLFSSGAVRAGNGLYGGTGTVRYESVVVDGYKLGAGNLAFNLQENKATITGLNLRFGGGELSSKLLTIGLKDRFPINGELVLKDVRFDGILDAVKEPDSTVRWKLSGPMDVEGFLTKPLQIKGSLRAQFPDFAVLVDAKKPTSEENSILNFPGGKIDVVLNFTEDRFTFTSSAQILDGSVSSEGYFAFNNTAKVSAKVDRISLYRMGRVADLRLGGFATAAAEINVGQGADVEIAGNFEVGEAELAQLYLGAVRGQAVYRGDLLSFENMVVATSFEPVTGSGFVDFKAEPTHYRFQADIKRIEIDEILEVFRKQKLKFSPPKGGELANTRLLIEGGHDDEGIEVSGVGQGKSFTWYNEPWQSTSFNFLYRPASTEINRMLLMKKSGGVELRARFGDERSQMTFISQGLRMEELETLGRTPVAGEIAGQVTLFGDLSNPTGEGEVRLIRTSFRGNPLPDSTLRMTTQNKVTEIFLKAAGETLQGRLSRNNAHHEQWDVLLNLEQYDLTPLLSLWAGKDIPTLTDVTASGEVTLTGRWDDLRSFRGKGNLAKLGLGLRGTPMQSTSPIVVQVANGSVQVEKVNLVGKDSQLSFDLVFDPDRTLRSSFDAKIDLQYLQPFIPGLEYGAGKVSAGLRIAGRPQDFSVIGNVTLDDGTFRLSGFNDDFKGTHAQLSVSQDRINIDRFQTTVNGGTLNVEGDVRINRFRTFSPNLRLNADRVALRSGNYLLTRFSGDFALKGAAQPFALTGKCRIIEAALTSFDTGAASKDTKPPFVKFDVSCEGREKLFVTTDVMNAEFKGNLRLLGTNTEVGILGNVETLQGFLLFRERKFNITSGSVKFESPSRIAPRFSIAGRTMVKETSATNATVSAQAQEYEVNLQAVGTPENYRILLSSSPQLAEADIISLLLLGVTGRGQDGNYMDLGTTLVGQIPLQSKIESQIGFDIRLNTQSVKSNQTSGASTGTAVGSSASNDLTVTSVQIQKDLSKRTKVSYSNTLETIPLREFKIEHMLDDNLTINGTAADRVRGSTDTPTRSYGLDFRYRFQYE